MLDDEIKKALNDSYAAAAGGVLAKIQRLTNSPTSAVQSALRDLDDEIEALEEADEMLSIQNARLERVLRLMREDFSAAGGLISASGVKIEESGQKIAPVAITAMVFEQLSRGIKDPVNPARLSIYLSKLDALGVEWVAPTSLDFARKYVKTEAWASRMAKWGDGYADLIDKTVLDGIQKGWGPRYTAGKLRQLVEKMPRAAAENITRTLQLTSYRDAALAMEQINGGFIEYKIRLCALAATSCLTCIALHGTRLEKGERVDDHPNGMCDEFYVVYGGPRQPEFMRAENKIGDFRPGVMQAATAKAQLVPFQTGEQWFAGLPAERQAAQRSFMQSPAKLRAYRAGTPLSEFIGERQDDVFGRQVVEKSLVRAIGTDAEKFYSVNQEE